MNRAPIKSLLWLECFLLCVGVPMLFVAFIPVRMMFGALLVIALYALWILARRHGLKFRAMWQSAAINRANLAPIFRRFMLSALLMVAFIFVVTDPASASQKLERSISIDGVERTYTIYLPDNVATKRDLPVIIAFHPATAQGIFMERAARFHSMPKSDGFIVVYPDGIDRRWNAGRCCGSAKSRNIDDVAFFRAMMKDVSMLASVRPKAYITGFSNGAFLVYHLMCKAGDQVAAAAPYGGFIAPEDMLNCKGGPVPMMHVHGEEDPAMSINGGDMKFVGLMPPLITTVKWVAKKNGADVDNPVYVDMPELGTKCLRYSGLTETTETSVCIIPKLGHVWPGVSILNKKFGAARPDLQGSEAIINFFLRY